MPDKGEEMNVMPSVIRIALLGLFIDEDAYAGSDQDLINFQISQVTYFRLSEEIGNFKLTFIYTYQATGVKIIEATVLTSLKINGFLKFVKWFEEKNDVKNEEIPSSILITCLSVAISNTRTILFQQLATTIFHNKIAWPILNSVEIFNVLYPEGIKLLKEIKEPDINV